MARLEAGDASDDAPASPLSVYRSTYVHAGFESPHERIWVESMLSTKTGPDNYPGDSVPSQNWPGFAPGRRGVLNTMAPGVFNTSALVDLADKPDILWIHGDSDAIVSDASFFDLNCLGKAGVLPGWPGEEAAPLQPMVSQTRAVLEKYAANGGRFTEVLLENCGHSPHLEYPDRFIAELTAQIGRSGTVG